MKAVPSLIYKVRLRQLRCFIETAQQNSFIAAANTLGLTQPAVSRSIRELEKILDVDLFDRSQRGAILTPAGERLLASSESGLAQISQGLNLAINPTISREVITLGALPNFCSQFLPAIIKEFKNRYPAIQISIAIGSNAELLTKLRNNEVCFVLGRLAGGNEMSGLVFEQLYNEPLVFVARQGHPLVKQKNIRTEEVVSYPMLLPNTGTIIREEADRFFVSKGILQIENTIETIASNFITAYLQQTDSVALVPRGVVIEDLKEKKLALLQLGHEELSGPAGISTRPDTEFTLMQSELLFEIRKSQFLT